jgi:hypothetical protein
VIDNASPDGSGDRLSSLIPNNEFLQLENNTGYACGNNIGIRIAMGADADYVFIVNPDVRLSPSSIRDYVKIMEADQSISALNPIQLDSAGHIDAFFRREVFDRNGYPTPSLPTDNAASWDVKTLFGAALFIRHQTLEHVGGFDPLYFAYWEEVDLCRRILFHGGRLIVVGASPVTHHRTYLHGPIDTRRQYLRLRGMHLFRMKEFNKPFLSQMIKSLLELLKNTIRGDKGQFNWSRWQYTMTIIWCLANMYAIYSHRKLDRSGRAYI